MSNLLGNKLKSLLKSAPKSGEQVQTSPNSEFSSPVPKLATDGHVVNAIVPSSTTSSTTITPSRSAAGTSTPASTNLKPTTLTAKAESDQNGRKKETRRNDTNAKEKQAALQACRVTLRNVNSGATAAEIAMYLEKTGSIVDKVECEILKPAVDSEQASNGRMDVKSVYITCANPESALKLVALDGQRFMGRTLRVYPAKTLVGHVQEVTPAAPVSINNATQVEPPIPLLPERGPDEKIVLPAAWLRAIGRQFLRTELSKLSPENVHSFCPANVADFCKSFDGKPEIPAVVRSHASHLRDAMNKHNNDSEQQTSDAPSKMNPTGSTATQPSHQRAEGTWDTAEISGQSKKDKNIAEMQRLQFEKEREAILAQRAAANSDKPVSDVIPDLGPTRLYHEESDEVMASLMASAASVSIVDHNVGRIGGKGVIPQGTASTSASKPLQELVQSKPSTSTDVDIDYFLRERSQLRTTSLLAGGDIGMGGSRLLGGNSNVVREGLSLFPADDIFADGNSLSVPFNLPGLNDSTNMGSPGGVMDPNALFDFDSLLIDSGLLPMPVVPSNPNPPHSNAAGATAVRSAPQQVAPSPTASPGTRITMSALFASKSSQSQNNVVSAVKPKDVLSLYEVEAGETIPVSERTQINITSPVSEENHERSAPSGTGESPFAFHGQGASATKTSSGKKAPMMSAASRMQLAKMSKKTPTKEVIDSAEQHNSPLPAPEAPSVASSSTSVDATKPVLRKLNVNKLFKS